MINTAVCIKHEHSVLVQNSVVGELHEVLKFNEFGILDIDWCDFPMGWATCEPPTNFDDDLLVGYWDTDLVEPSDEELAEMDANI